MNRRDKGWLAISMVAFLLVLIMFLLPTSRPGPVFVPSVLPPTLSAAPGRTEAPGSASTPAAATPTVEVSNGAPTQPRPAPTPTPPHTNTQP